MAGHRTPVPRIQSEPRAARPSAAASVLSLDFGSHHMEDDNLKSELERLKAENARLNLHYSRRSRFDRQRA